MNVMEMITLTIAQARKNMIVYLKNMAGYKMEHFKGMSYDKVRPIFEREYNKVQTLFKPDKDVVEPTKKIVAKETLLQESFKKLRAEVEVLGSESTQDTPTDDPKEMSEEDVKNMLEIVPVTEFKYPDVHTPSQEISDEAFHAKEDLMKSIQTFLEEFNCIPFEEKPTILLQAWFKFFAIKHDQPEDSNKLFHKLFEDLKELAEYKESLENSSKEIDASNSIQEKEEPPQDSDIHQLIEECSTEVSEEQKQSMEDTMLELVKICRQKELLCMHDNKLLKDLKELAEYDQSTRTDCPIFNDNENHHVQNKESHENSSEEAVVSKTNQEPPQDSDIHQLIEECSIKVHEQQKQKMDDTMLELVKICQEKEFLCIHDDVDDLIKSALDYKLLLINSNSQRPDKKEQEVKNVVEQPAEHGNRSI
uniref:Uncharacterized protein n=1 Tax=Tanacetum cinerariifolium TaxID=118510 RepID=A0A699H8I0_TANCI|nr:hypothetical protein [Tanacetum cinerariifolium]